MRSPLDNRADELVANMIREIGDPPTIITALQMSLMMYVVKQVSGSAREEECWDCFVESSREIFDRARAANKRLN